ncbi:MAG: exodeoxyribonuclease VII large subunit [Acidimicrobiaceae bacterium]|nr:exodeoxyribonuclease VII large subunit [Acidimicrobiaceae bacterium]|tara:strand:- start:6408 stop:7664 length:1257 start_codon:yes stop_codon:yes gene_type:complete
MTETHTWSVGDLCEAIRDTFTAVFPEEIWLEGEISGLKFHSSGHVYFDLIEPDTNGNGIDKMSIALWRGRRQAVESVLNRADAGPLTEGIKVRIKGELSFYAPQGRVQIQMTAIDPHHTLGQLSVDRERVLQSLHKAGLLETNSSLQVPTVPLHIGLVTSDGSAAYNDFVNEISSSQYPFRISLAHSPVQGAEAEMGLVKAIQQLVDTDVDVIAVVRGGGARTDLLAFDLESVARAVALAPIPVFSGIGHEIDRSIVDEVVHTAFKTPTACAASIVQIVTAFDQQLNDSARRIVTLANNCHDRAAEIVSSSARAINDRTRRTLDLKEGQLTAASGRLRDLSSMALDRNVERCNRIFDLLQALHPNRILARGFSITRDKAGNVIRDAVPDGATIVSETSTSLITSTVTGSELRDREEET